MTTETREDDPGLPHELTAFYDALEDNLVRHAEQWTVLFPDHSTDAHKMQVFGVTMKRYRNLKLDIELVEVEEPKKFPLHGATTCLFFGDQPLPCVPDGITKVLSILGNDALFSAVMRVVRSSDFTKRLSSEGE